MVDQKNLILAIVVSIAILLLFQLFIEGPRQAERQQQLAEQQAITEEAGDAVPTFDGDVAAIDGVELTDQLLSDATSRDAALAEGPRVQIATPRLHGSLSLVGARFDDLTLDDYHETVDPTSPPITLLSPRRSPSPYYVDFGWTLPEGRGGEELPGPDTLWSADTDTLTPEQPVTLTWENGQGLLFERVVAIDENYMLTVTQRVTNNGRTSVPLVPYGIVRRWDTPDTLGFFILHEGPYGVFDGTLEEYDYDDLQSDGLIEYSSIGGWLGFTDKYWLVALVPDQEAEFQAQFRHSQPGGRNLYAANYFGAAVTVTPGDSAEVTNRVFAGAKEVELIDAYEAELGIERFELTIDFGWFYFLTKPFFYALAWINSIVGNFGVSILIFTVFIKLLFFPLANKSYKAMSKMKALQPEMMQIRERFSEDRQKMNMEMMALYRREKVNPAAGCLPILLQIPVFFALYKVLFVTIEMRHAPFFGWIQDLSAPDPTSIFNLFGLIPISLPGFLMIGIWPLIMGVTMFLQQKLNPPPADPMQQKIFMALPIVFTFLLAQFPAGLVIYWAWNNSLSILQQWVIMRRMGVKIGGGMAPPPAGSKAPAGATNQANPFARKKPAAGAASAGAKATAEAPANEAEPVDAVSPTAAANEAPSDPPAAPVKPGVVKPKRSASRAAARRRSGGGGGGRRRG